MARPALGTIVAALSLQFFLAQAFACHASPIPNTTATPDRLELYVTVTDIFGTSINSLKEEHFSIWVDNKRVPITFFSDKPMPASVSALFDVSRSTPAAALKLATQSFHLLRRESHPSNEYSVAAFGEQENLLANWTNQEAEITTALAKTQKTKLGNDTALFDALYAAIKRMESATHKRRVLILFSVGCIPLLGRSQRLADELLIISFACADKDLRSPCFNVRMINCDF
jgi:VWFA-related protein